MAIIKIQTNDIDGNQVTNEITIPDFAMESTLEKIALKMGAIEKLSDQTKETIKNQTETIKDGIKTDEESRKQLAKTLSESLRESGRLRDKVTADILDNMEKDLKRAGNIITNVVTTLVGLGTLAGGFVLKGFTNLGEGLKTLTAVGGAFGDNLSGVGASAEQNVISLNKLGLTTDQAINVLGNYSRSMAILGQSSVIGASKTFLDLTKDGTALGTTLDEATEFFQEDLMFRTMMLRRDQISAEQSARYSAVFNQNLRRLSTLLGANSDEVRKNTQDVLSGNTAFRAFTSSLGPGGKDLLEGANLLGSGLIASLGGAGETVTDGLLRIASTGVGAIDDFVNQLNPLAPGAAQAIKDVSMQLRRGQISTVEQANRATLQIVEAFNGVDQATINRLIPIIDSVGGELAGTGKILVEAFVNSGAAAEKLRKSLNIAPEFSDTQKGLTTFQNVTAKARASLSAFQNALASGAGKGMKGISEFFESLLSNSKLAEYMAEQGKRFGDRFSKFINDLGGVDVAVKKIMNGFNAVIDYVYNIFDELLKGFQTNGKLDIIGGVKNAFILAVKEALKLTGIAIKEAFIAVITNPGVVLSIIAGFTALFAMTSVARGFASVITAGMGSLFAKAAAGLGLTTMTTAGSGLGASLLGGAATTGAGVYYDQKSGRYRDSKGRYAKAPTTKPGFKMPRGGLYGLAGLGIGMGADYLTESAGGLNTTAGRTVNTLGQGAEYALYGAALGSIIPGLGTAIGAGVGGAIGLVKGLFFDSAEQDQPQQANPTGDNIFNLEAKTVSISEPFSVVIQKPLQMDTYTGGKISRASVNSDIGSLYSNSNLTMDRINEGATALADDGMLSKAEKSAIADVSSSNEMISTMILMLQELKRSNRHLSNISDKPTD